ncbi:dockerin type I domain-containing protein [Candidatus Methanomassiliicoccus intestinalis]|uniref:dockerin type I domain-containing protein n=1 Tax=Candidatus Methanomassiliicoccus intestinalis TaxID=1406512 RepID=UPI0037DCD218
MNNKVIAVAVVIIIAIAGIGVMIFLNNDSSASNQIDDNVRLKIYGNADDNDAIDEQDLTMLEKIIAQEEGANEHLYADANQDGVIDEKDLDWVKDMIDKKPMTIYYKNARSEVKSVNYPVENIVVVGTNVLAMVKAIGGSDLISGIHGGDIDSILYSDLIDLPRISDSTFKADFELVSKLDGVQAIVTQDSVSYVENESEFTNTNKIEVIRVAASDGLDTISGALTLGYLLNLEDRAEAYAKFTDDILSYIDSKVGKGVMDDADRVTSISVTMSNYVGGTASDYYTATELAGSKNVGDWNTTTQRFNIGEEWLLEYDPDFIIHAKSIGYGTIDIQKAWDTYSQYFKDMNAYKDGNYYILNGNMPVALRIAYMAQVFYPEIFGENYGEQLHQQYIDNFVDNLHEIGYDVSKDGIFLITSSMVSV